MGCGCCRGVGAVVDRDSIQRRGRSERGAQRLRDISHLYLSSSNKVRPSANVPQRRLRLGFATIGDGLAKVDLCANLAVQYARLGRRTLVIDLDPALPNIGFRMGVAPELYLAHLLPKPRAVLARSAPGVRLLSGVADSDIPDVPQQVQSELEKAECVLVSLAAQQARLRWLTALQGDGSAESAEPRPRRPSPQTTMRRAGAESRMFGAWLASARRGDRPPTPRATAPSVLDAVLFVQQDDEDDITEQAMQQWRHVIGEVPVHLVRWNSGSQNRQSRLSQWATIEALPDVRIQRQPLSLLDPQHATSRVFENLAQSLLASLAAPGGARVRAS